MLMTDLVDSLLHTVTEGDLGGDGLLELGDERVVHAGLDEDAVGGDASLAGVTELGSHAALDREVEVGRVEDDEGGVAAELQGDLLHGRGTLAVQDLAHAGGSGEGQGANLEL